MELTDEMKALITEEAEKIAQAKAADIVKQITEDNERRIAKLTAAHNAEIKTYKDSIKAIISGKGEDPEKAEIEKLIDRINERRKRS